jgi:hypothetical protein
MKDAVADRIQRLQDQAVRCVRLSKSTTDARMIAALATLARDFNDAAARLEAEHAGCPRKGAPC